jgi:hypothetical protein
MATPASAISTTMARRSARVVHDAIVMSPFLVVSKTLFKKNTKVIIALVTLYHGDKTKPNFTF